MKTTKTTGNRRYRAVGSQEKGEVITNGYEKTSRDGLEKGEHDEQRQKSQRRAVVAQSSVQNGLAIDTWWINPLARHPPGLEFSLSCKKVSKMGPRWR